jgi:hypothetical protein
VSLGGVPRSDDSVDAVLLEKLMKNLHLFPHRPVVWIVHVDVASRSFGS